MSNGMLAIFWLVLAAVLLVVEVSTVSLVSIWFVAGALAAAFLAFVHVGFVFQLPAFLVISAVLFYFCKDRLYEFFRFRHDRSGAVQILGKTGEVTTAIAPGQDGRVLVSGQDWKASSRETLQAGMPVKVIGMHGVTLEVQPQAKGKTGLLGLPEAR